MNKIDILAIGDIAAEPFIKIKDNDAEETCSPVDGHCKLCLNFGGKIPYESNKICHAVGNSSNFAIGTSRLGLNSALMTNLGNDEDGNECLDVLKKENIDTSHFINRNPRNWTYTNLDDLRKNYKIILNL